MLQYRRPSLVLASAGGPPSTGPVDGFGGWAEWELGLLRGEKVNPVSASTEIEEDIRSSSESSQCHFRFGTARDEMKTAKLVVPSELKAVYLPECMATVVDSSRGHSLLPAGLDWAA